MHKTSAMVVAPTTFVSDVAFPVFWNDKVPDGAFEGNKSIQRVSVPNRIEATGTRAFSGCSGLVEVTLPDMFVELGSQTFYDCGMLAHVALSETLVEIGSFSFFGCSKLETVVLPASLARIGEFAFRGCSKLVAVGWHCTSLLTIPMGAFCGCVSLHELVLPAAVHTISGSGSRHAPGAFEGCTNLSTLVLPAALKSLCAYAFKGATANLKMLVVPHAVPNTVAITMAAMLGPRRGKVPGKDVWDPDTLDMPAVTSVQLVSAPDVVVASLGGVFSEMTTMTEVRAARRDVTSVLDYQYWSVKTHRHICTSSQRICAHTVLLFGARLYSQVMASSSVLLLDPLLTVAQSQAALPAMPEEIWLEVLTWLRRSELGTTEST
jgi:hypothetical protein